MGARVLVVESVPADARQVKARLTLGSFHLAAAAGGDDALRVATEWQPDIVLLAATLPDMPGIEVCRRIKKAPSTADALVVMVAGSEDPERELSELMAGADEFVTKPAELALLPQRLRRLTRFKRVRDEYAARSETARELAPAVPLEPAPSLLGARAAIVAQRGPEASLAREWLARDGVEGVVPTDPPERARPLADDFDLVVLDPATRARGQEGPSRSSAAGERNRRLPRLLIGEKGDAARAMEHGGVDDWITRPISEARLRARARAQILHRRYWARLHADRARTRADERADPLGAGIFDARYAERHLRRLLEGAAMRDLAVLLIEVDRLDRIRERSGHAGGERVLRAVATTLGANLRSFDTLARHGEDRFVLLMPGATSSEALNVAERLRDAIAIMPLPPDERDAVTPLSVSVGIAVGAGARSSAEELLSRAAEALGDAHRAGSNRVELARAERGASEQ